MCAGSPPHACAHKSILWACAHQTLPWARAHEMLWHAHARVLWGGWELWVTLYISFNAPIGSLPNFYPTDIARWVYRQNLIVQCADLSPPQSPVSDREGLYSGQDLGVAWFIPGQCAQVATQGSLVRAHLPSGCSCLSNSSSVPISSRSRSRSRRRNDSRSTPRTRS